MPAPTSVQTWDSNGTNLTTTTSGHRTDGWANNEIPTAGEFNYWMKSVADWIEYVKAAITASTRWHWFPANSAAVLEGGATAGAGSGTNFGTGAIQAGTGQSFAKYIPITVPVGAIIDQIAVKSRGDGAGDLGVYLIEHDSGSPDIIRTFQILDQSSTWAITTNTLSSSYTVVDGKPLSFILQFDNASSNNMVEGVAVRANWFGAI